VRTTLQMLALLLSAAALALPLSIPRAVEGQGASQALTNGATEALTTDMDCKTNDLFNGYGAMGTPVDDCVAEAKAPTARGNGTFEDNKFIFSERETVDEGLGPTYNDVGCVECHQSVDVGGFSQAMEFRAGHTANGQFVGAPGGQLIHARGTDADVVEHISTSETIKAFRITLSTLGDGYIECLSNTALENNIADQPPGQRGTLTEVPVVEANNALRIGRFGWKAQQASLLSFSGDAYLNEMGITNKFDGSNGRSSSDPGAGSSENPASTADGITNVNFPSAFDPVADPEDDGGDVLAFADFMAATRAPGRQKPIPAAANRGDALFTSVGCAVCHTRTFTTANPGTLINGGTFRVPAALGNKIIHPFSDFALHNVGTGDGIVQNAGQSSANQIRTPPLWGIRARNRLMHEGLNITVFDSIQLHAGQATAARNNFNNLSAGGRSDLIAFILSL
jgi:CxxC motif-containing protein (DUF1111 family)